MKESREERRQRIRYQLELSLAYDNVIDALNKLCNLSQEAKLLGHKKLALATMERNDIWEFIEYIYWLKSKHIK